MATRNKRPSNTRNTSTRNTPGQPTKLGEDLKVGDILVVFGHHVRIGFIDAPTSKDEDWVVGRAKRADRQWGMTITRGDRYEVA